jgi:hypothetical protein
VTLTHYLLINTEKEIILEEHVAYNAEHIHKDQSQNSRQDDGTTVTGHGSDDVQECFFTIYNIK